MEIRKFVLALTTAALLPTFAYADNDTDAIRASFEHILDHEIAFDYAPAAIEDTDPLVDAIADALNNASQADTK